MGPGIQGIPMSDVQKRLSQFLSKRPTVGKGVYIAPGAIVLGDVTIGDHSSIWCNAVLRADINFIKIGHHTNLQDTCVVHLADEFPCVVGNYVTVGHGVILHACTVADEVLVGMGAVIMDGVSIGAQSLIGAGALVVPGTQVPAGSVVLGTPAKVVRSLSPAERGQLRQWAEKYVRASGYYLKHGPVASPRGK
jgi:carbonic anhydrase/acetyltransferase-like protein (isoleucine patch superfamily)